MNAKCRVSMLFVVLGAGCGANPDAPMEDDPSAQATVEVTEVTLVPGQADVVRRGVLRRAEFDQMRAAAGTGRVPRNGMAPPVEPAPGTGAITSVAQAIEQDRLCGGASVYLYDDFRSLICFRGRGTARLGNYCRRSPWDPYGSCYQTWSGAVREIWPGSEPGALGKWLPIWPGALLHWYGCNPTTIEHHGIGWSRGGGLILYEPKRPATACERDQPDVRLCPGGCGDY